VGVKRKRDGERREVDETTRNKETKIGETKGDGE